MEIGVIDGDAHSVTARYGKMYVEIRSAADFAILQIENLWGLGVVRRSMRPGWFSIADLLLLPLRTLRLPLALSQALSSSLAMSWFVVGVVGVVVVSAVVGAIVSVTGVDFSGLKLLLS